MKILITGSAGFIGFHLVKRLVGLKDAEVVGIDNINDYYDVNLKYTRLEHSGIDRGEVSANVPVKSAVYQNYSFCKMDISDHQMLSWLFKEHVFDYVIHMAAQAGVRHSIDEPGTYIQSNIVGFANILECCRHNRVKHVVYASSSSVYGINANYPSSENENTDYPVSLYAATKKSNELLAHSYSHLFHLPTTGVRLFTVYGPWGRPDMAPVLFAEAIYEDRPIKVFNKGDMLRDFTYIDDVVNGIAGLLFQIPGMQEEHPYYRLFNIGNSDPVKLLDFISTLEKNIGKKACLDLLPMQPGDVTATYADITRLKKCINYEPLISVEKGIYFFIEWIKMWKKYDAIQHT